MQASAVKTVTSRRSKEKTISILAVKPDMILSRDVITETGAVLLAKGTMVNRVNFTKLKAHNISEIFVKESSINDKLPSIAGEIHTIERQRVPLSDRDDFREFVKVYDEKREQVKKYLHAISDGATIDLQELYLLTDGIMSKLKCKSDIFAFISSIHDVSEHTFTHSNNVALLANLFGRWLDLTEDDMIYLTTAGVLHDIGKIKTPPEILNKKGRLSEQEFNIMKQHTVHGYRMLRNQDIPDEIKLTALLHHEKIDGSGYPLGMTSEKINGISKIISIVDIYDAMTANRTYRGKLCPFDVIRSFETKGYGELDTEFLWIFLRNIAYTYIGNWVRLSNGHAAEVMFINQNNLARPIVRADDSRVIDLMYSNDLFIMSLI